MEGYKEMLTSFNECLVNSATYLDMVYKERTAPGPVLALTVVLHAQITAAVACVEVLLKAITSVRR